MNVPASAGRCVVVPDADTPSGSTTARRGAAAGAAVVCVGSDADALGALVGALVVDGARAAIYVGDPADAALGEMAAELFEPRD